MRLLHGMCRKQIAVTVLTVRRVRTSLKDFVVSFSCVRRLSITTCGRRILDSAHLRGDGKPSTSAVDGSGDV